VDRVALAGRQRALGRRGGRGRRVGHVELRHQEDESDAPRTG
jgi:hypothetical protein